MSLWESLREAERSWSSDDDRLWAQLVGAVLAIGLCFRAAIHAWTALLASDILDEEIDPHLADTDVSLASPVLGIREHRTERVARFATGVFGLGAWVALQPFATRPTGVATFLAVNIAVCLGDPLWGVLNYLRVRQGRRTVQTTNIMETNR